jgi:hypothetical protein
LDGVLVGLSVAAGFVVRAGAADTVPTDASADADGKGEGERVGGGVGVGAGVSIGATVGLGLPDDDGWTDDGGAPWAVHAPRATDRAATRATNVTRIRFGIVRPTPARRFRFPPSYGGAMSDGPPAIGLQAHGRGPTGW